MLSWPMIGYHRHTKPHVHSHVTTINCNYDSTHIVSHTRTNIHIQISQVQQKISKSINNNKKYRRAPLLFYWRLELDPVDCDNHLVLAEGLEKHLEVVLPVQTVFPESVYVFLVLLTQASLPSCARLNQVKTRLQKYKNQKCNFLWYMINYIYKVQT